MSGSSISRVCVTTGNKNDGYENKDLSHEVFNKITANEQGLLLCRYLKNGLPGN